MTVAQDPQADYTLPVDRTRAFDPSLYPADPDAYEPLTHFLQRQRDEERHLTKLLDEGPAVREAIERGRLRDNNDGCAVFVYPYHGVSYYIVVGFHLDGYRIAVTGWPVLHHKGRALNSVEWTESELADIEQFNEGYNS